MTKFRIQIAAVVKKTGLPVSLNVDIEANSQADAIRAGLEQAKSTWLTTDGYHKQSAVAI